MSDPRKQQRRDEIRAACAAAGIVIQQRGECYALQGLGVDLKTNDLANLDVNDLAPYAPRKK